MERETGIEPASLAWKARVLPLNYSRISDPQAAFAKPSVLGRLCVSHSQIGGGGWIRTSVGVSQQIYSLPPLATRAPLRTISNYSLKIQANTTRGLINSIYCTRLLRATRINPPQNTGAAGGDRTHDPWLRRPILYPLSYSRNHSPASGCKHPLQSLGLWHGNASRCGRHIDCHIGSRLYNF